MMDLPLDKLTFKVVMLMALTTAHRVQTLQKLKLDRMVSTPNKVTSFIDELLKQHRPGTTGLKMEFLAYPVDVRL